MYAKLCVFINLWLMIWATSSESDSYSNSDSNSNNCSGQFEVWSSDILNNVYCNPHCPLQFEPKPPCALSEGCICMEGYTRDIATGQCIDQDYCPAPGDPNVVFSPCHADDQATCDDYSTFTKPKDASAREDCEDDDSSDSFECRCIPGYVCVKGYVKNEDGFCVPPKNCTCSTTPQ